jgi:hypothetical protein
VTRQFFPDISAGVNQVDERSERAFVAFEKEFPEAVKRGDYLGLPADRPAIADRFQALASLLGPEDALEIVELDCRVLLFTKEYVARAWELIKEKETPDTVTALSVVKKNPGLLTCEAYGLSAETMESLDRTASVIESLRPLGLGNNAFFFVATIGFVFILVTLRFVGKALAPVTDQIFGLLSGVPKPLEAVGGLLGQ